MTIVIIDHTPNSVDFVDNIFTIHNGMLRDSTRMKAVKEFENGSYITYSKDNLAYRLVEKSDNINSKKQKFLGVLQSSPMANVMSAKKSVEFKIIGKRLKIDVWMSCS